MTTMTGEAPALPAELVQMLQEKAQRNPLAGLLLARMQEAAAAPDPLDDLEHRLTELLEANARLRQALHGAREATDWVARLVGCCPQCWGLVDTCPACRGRGKPGSSEPAVSELVSWLRPALRRAGIGLVRLPDPRDVFPTPRPPHNREEESRRSS